MYIRRTQTRNTTTGERYFTYRLVRSERVGGKVRQVTVLNLGRHFAVGQADWPALCARLQEILSGQEALLGGTGTVLLEREAQRLAAQLLARQGVVAPAEAGGAAAPVEVHSVAVDSLTLSRPRTVGVEAVALWAMRQVDFVGLLARLRLSGPQRAAVLGVIVGRMAAPGSELATQRWLCERSALGELLDVDFEAMSLMQLYRAGDVLMRHRAALEEAVFTRLSDGIATAENLTWLRAGGYCYLVVSRERHRHFDPDQATDLQTAGGECVSVQRVVDAEGQEVRLYCHSELRARKEEGIAERFAQRFEAGLQALADGLSRPRTTKRIDKLWERIGRLKEKSHGAAQHYHIELVPDEGARQAQAIRWERRPIEGTLQTHPGVYCLRTNELSWDGEQLWRTYMMLTDLEAVFRSCKSELGLRPIFHHKEVRADGHLFITVLAYQLVQLIRRRLHEQGLNDSWASLRETLNGQVRVTATFRRPDGRALHVRKATQAEPGQRQIYQALGINSSPGGVSKLLV